VIPFFPGMGDCGFKVFVRESDKNEEMKPMSGF
jgi:hypothetical protein